MKKKLTIAGVFVALAAFSMISVAAASGHGFGGGSSERLDRVAEILGVTPDELSSAMEQARSEERAARLEEKLANAVEEEVLTQEEADAIRDWFDGKPEALDELSRSDRHGLRQAQRDDSLAEFLTGLVAEEVLTQAESDEIATWLDTRPSEALEKIKPESRGHRFHGRHGRHGFHGFKGFRDHSSPAVPETETGSTATSVVYY